MIWMDYKEDEYITVFYLSEGDYFIDELEVEGIYRQINEVLDKMDDNLNLYYYAWLEKSAEFRGLYVC